MRIRSILVVALLLFVPGMTLAQVSQSPHRAQEVAVYAAPAQLAGFTIVKYLPNAGITVIRVQPGSEQFVAGTLRDLGYRAGVNRVATKFGTPNDTFFSFQWHMTRVQAETAWDTTSGSGAVVAVLDSGLTQGPDGIANTLPGWDAVDGDGNPSDGDGHGTHVAGTIGQTTNNNTGTAGLAYSANVMPVRVLDNNGNGNFADIADGLWYAINSGADVVNMSLGTNAKFGITSDPVMDAALDAAYAAGITVVCASGNDSHRKNVGYPAIYSTTIAVGATDYRDRVPRYSNKGTGLDIVAPGGDLARDDNGDGYADGVLQETFDSGGFGYFFFQGTSMASPHVAAAAALLYSSGVATNPDDVYSALTCTAQDLGDAGFDSTNGHGLLQAAAALTWTPGNCGGGTGCTDNDGDGVCVPDDCNDNDASIYPGANDTRGKKGRDGIDNDCDGIIDG